MKKVLFTIITFTIIIFSSCGDKSKEEASSENNSQNDSTMTGSIKKMWWWNYQGIGDDGITIDDKISLTISQDALGDNNTRRIFINSEVKDILFLDKENGKDRLNLKYLDKNVTVTFNKKTLMISKIELIGGEKTVLKERTTINGFITGFQKDTKGNLLVDFKNENGKVEKYRLGKNENGGYNNDLFLIYHGKGKVADYIFRPRNYEIELVPNNADKNVQIICETKLVKDAESNSNEGSKKEDFYNELVITEISWGNSSMGIKSQTEELKLVSGGCSDDGCSLVFVNGVGKEIISTQFPDKIIQFDNDGDSGGALVNSKYLNKKYSITYKLKNVHHEESNSDDIEMVIEEMKMIK